MQLCLRYPVIGTYRSLLWVALRNERILRDIRNLITVSLFSLFFVCLLYIYCCFAVLKLIELLRVRIINNYVGFETRLRTNSPKFHKAVLLLCCVLVSSTYRSVLRVNCNDRLSSFNRPRVCQILNYSTCFFI